METAVLISNIVVIVLLSVVFLVLVLFLIVAIKAAAEESELNSKGCKCKDGKCCKKKK